VSQERLKPIPLAWPQICTLEIMLAGQWQDLTVATAHPADLVHIETALADLDRRKFQPTAYSSAIWQATLLRHVEGTALVQVSQGDKLYLSLSLKKKRRPLPLYQVQLSGIGGSGLPLIDKEIPEAAWNTFLAAQDHPVLLMQVPMDGQFYQMMKSQTGHFSIIDQWQRAGLRPVGTFENWFEQNFERKRRKEYRRLRNRLAEEGELVSEALSRSDDVTAWVEDLLALEAAGWKGKRGTALKAKAGLAEALHEAAAKLHLLGQFRIWRLRLNGKTIAALYAMIDSDEAWLGKIAFDESLGRFSPGVMLMLDVTERLFAEKTLRLIDSCAIPQHPMIDNIWRDRISMATVMVAPPGMSTLRFKSTVFAFKNRGYLRDMVRDLYYKLTGRHRS
jgi:CelD/BcsL family acetyltransferase involved in cellulose biosynthesis